MTTSAQRSRMPTARSPSAADKTVAKTTVAKTAVMDLVVRHTLPELAPLVCSRPSVQMVDANRETDMWLPPARVARTWFGIYSVSLFGQAIMVRLFGRGTERAGVVR